MSSSLNVVALISGGKDSLYSILHCLESGHKVVALANLYPAPPQSNTSPSQANDVDDIDSFMYQTVGHRIISLYSEALSLPLYRRAISGSTTQTHRDYATPTTSAELQDETEDLVPLLKQVVEDHPEVNAVSTGAILSTYQRTRVESVAIRLGLIPLSYLWQYPFLPSAAGEPVSMTGLLDDMAAMGCEARIIKIATGGLDDNMLWADVCDPRSRAKLVNGMQRFVQDDSEALKAAVLGEGGEFETIALNGPPPLWKQRIVIDKATNTVIRGEGGTSSIRLGPATTTATQVNVTERLQLRLPKLLDAPFDAVQRACLAKIDHSFLFHSIPTPPPQQPSSLTIPQSVAHFWNTMTISNLQFPLTITPSSLRQSILSAFPSLPFIPHNPDPLSSIVFATLLVRSMSSFAHINTLWTSLFSLKPNPPARVTISCGSLLPPGTDFSVSLVVDTGPRKEREGLHVQSWSYWAPANIGPYSQAISVPLEPERDQYSGIDGQKTELVYIAGQIPLVPSTMTLHTGAFVESAILSLQHLWRIGTVQKVDWWVYGIAFLARDSPSNISQKAQIAYETWRGIHLENTKPPPSTEDDEDMDVDVWDLKYAADQHLPHFHSQSARHAHRIPNPKILSSQGNPPPPPPFLALEIDVLPRSAPIEWQSLGICALVPTSTSTTTASLTVHSTSFTAPSSPSPSPRTKFAVLTLPPDPATSPSQILLSVLLSLDEDMGIAHVALYTTPSFTNLLVRQEVENSGNDESSEDVLAWFPDEIKGVVMVVPCYRILAPKTGEGGEEKGGEMGECMAAMVVRLEP